MAVSASDLGKFYPDAGSKHTKNHYLFNFHSKMLNFRPAGSLEHPYAHFGCLGSEIKAHLEQENVQYISYSSNFDDVKA